MTILLIILMVALIAAAIYATLADLRLAAAMETRDGLLEAIAGDAADSLVGMHRSGWIDLREEPTLRALVEHFFGEGLGEADETDAAEDWADQAAGR